MNQVKKAVCDMQGGAIAGHVKDLKYCVLKLSNAIVEGIRGTSLYKVNFIDVVLNASKIMEESTLMREKLTPEEREFKNVLVEWYLGEKTHKIPSFFTNFKQLTEHTGGGRQNHVKQAAIDFVLMMYRMHCIDLKEFKKEVGLVDDMDYHGGDNAWTARIKELFEEVKNGSITKEEYVIKVADAYKEYKARVGATRK